MNDSAPTFAIREKERRRLARLLETRLGQSLNLLLEQANAYQAALPPAARARPAIRALAAMAGRALADLYDLEADLAPTDLYDLGLSPALETLALRIERRYGLTVTLDLPDITDTLAHLKLAVYRVALEALHNAGQHAGAGRVGLSLRLERDSLRLTIADDGDGFQPPEPLGALSVEEKWGLAEIADRVEAVGGEIEISSVLGVGTQVRARLPLTPSSASERPKRGQTPTGTDEALIEALTPRECDVLDGVAAGLTNKQIAARLGISDRTVQFHLGNVLGKLGVASRTEAAVLALQRGLV